MSFCSELNAKLDTIISQLGDLAACCGSSEVIYGNPPDYDLSGTGLVPQPIVDAGYASSTSDWAGYEDYKCMAAHILVENLKATVDSFASLIETAGITVVKVAGVLASAWFAWITGGASIVILGKFVVSDFIIWEALEALGSWVAADLHDLVGDIEDIREDIVCAAVNADGLYAIKSAVDTVLDTELSATAAALVKLSNMQTKINAFFAPVYGDVDVAAWLANYGADTADYDCPCSGGEIAKIASVTGCLSHSIGDVISEGEAINFQAVWLSGTNYQCNMVLTNVAGNGPVQDLKWRLTARANYFQASGDIDRGSYPTQAGAPYYGSPVFENYDFLTPDLPFYFGRDPGDAGYRITGGNSSAFTVTMKLYVP